MSVKNIFASAIVAIALTASLDFVSPSTVTAAATIAKTVVQNKDKDAATEPNFNTTTAVAEIEKLILSAK